MTREYRGSSPSGRGHASLLNQAGHYNCWHKKSMTLSVSNRSTLSCCSHPDPENHPTFWSSLQVVRTGTEKATMCEFLCLNIDPKELPLKAYTIQGQHAIPQLHLTKLPLWTTQQSCFSMMHGNPGFNDIEIQWNERLLGRVSCIH